MPDGAVELTADVLKGDKFQLIAFVTGRGLVAAVVVVGGRRHLVNGKRTGVVDEVRRSRAVLGSARFQTRAATSVHAPRDTEHTVREVHSQSMHTRRATAYLRWCL